MGIEPPFIYEPVKTDWFFDPKAVSRASLSPPAPRPKRPDGPLVNFNAHPDSYLIVPSGNVDVKSMHPSVKKRIKWTRKVTLALRCFQAVAAVGLLIMSILITGLDIISGWIMKLAPVIAIFHTIYGAYHLARKPDGRAPGSTASYMLFASLIDITIVPFYAYISLAAKTKQTTWTTSLSDQSLLTIFTDVLFYAATVGGGLHLISLSLSLYLAFTFRKINQLPPDMNPLEDNLTSRHKRNKSSISTFTTITSPSEKRLSRGSNLEDKRRSGAPYEDLDRPPTIPFLHTRTNSNESFQTNQSSPRTSRTGSPARYNAYKPNQSPRHSVPDFKPASRHSYTSVPASDLSFHTANESINKNNTNDGVISWFTNDSLGKKGNRSSAPSSRPHSPQKSSTSIKSSYHPLPLDPSAIDGDEDNFRLPNPLTENPPTPRHNFPSSSSKYSSEAPSAMAPDSNEQTAGPSSDITDESSWPLPLRSPEIRELTPKPLRTRDSGSGDSFKSKSYGDLKPATPPIMVGGDGIGRQVSSGTDFAGQRGGYRRDVSGKIAEEGRGGAAWGARLRNISGLQEL
ncbi:hypothetical protein SS1G_07606 [Sclerotinia sclerotiorum 1980 UF-70]|uniref:Uncharacterized protein n=2 Tax=Sclerotinia sclerotiorum (strain ATCC 18683 / 1980 / Ss-1) TaxID=665079 RepID=A0A1D9QFH5_SCLS1|nr:hypothetical protein SS1G_07606 [Sclerotinia sclerotiorum 1980 UF-70]APA13706.1 hypothetical protein sscle_11g084760 [Sclerotinia sclerotiorum 1980 UF-70]EDN91746.1 hypothetical protein SS1G_07606 [Sclerotinia sclerotiorum 1980 UF-70]